ncbi:hypothetical protein N0V83_005390 [Neocucurbitaria cava]|uniref:Nephrocystin 3-like N-terminal domain-containing protein n=1 Tax=Neocucurbitaria cava TaxID=798079 RepID=A0A9W8Y6N7_9PLEO|nr:hypothetical protein N0V83_005390 [Neocucurbitaria cava]
MFSYDSPVPASILCVLELLASFNTALVDTPTLQTSSSAKKISRYYEEFAQRVSDFEKHILKLKPGLERNTKRAWRSIPEHIITEDESFERLRKVLERILQAQIIDEDQLKNDFAKGLVLMQQLRTLTQGVVDLEPVVDYDSSNGLPMHPPPETLDPKSHLSYKEQNDANHRKFLDRISTYDHTANHRDRIKCRLEGTGQWFLDASEVVRWQGAREANGTLFCPGIPGAGKTVIAGTMIEHLFK